VDTPLGDFKKAGRRQVEQAATTKAWLGTHQFAIKIEYNAPHNRLAMERSVIASPSW